MPFDAEGNLWQSIEEHEADMHYEDEYTEAEIDESMAEFEAWEQTAEGQAAKAEAAAKRALQDADPNRLTNRIEQPNYGMLFAQAVQSIYDETGKPCRLRAAGERAGMDSDEYVVAGVMASVKGLVRHPVRNGYICTSLFEPGVG